MTFQNGSHGLEKSSKTDWKWYKTFRIAYTAYINKNKYNEHNAIRFGFNCTLQKWRLGVTMDLKKPGWGFYLHLLCISFEFDYIPHIDAVYA